ncbi:sodium:calcium antiporter [Frigoriglobus tundricola]|uniref:sodium:calcium antiporter n=1 Tax=Frigoriglobus tundricola TaxID=2774151 RepID=UPI00148EC122|nr:hypothetical protein [Frigoriglobus tundricola]
MRLILRGYLVEHVGLFVVGLALLAAGAPLLVFGAARLDRRAGRSPFAVGAVAIGLGPCLAGLAFDLAVLLRPVPQSMPRLAVGNIVGGNVANIGFALAVAALVRPVRATARVFYTAIPLAFGATLLFWFLARISPLSRVDAGFLLAACAVALVLLIRVARRESEDVKAEFAAWVPERVPVWLAVLFALAGAAALVGGALLAAEEALATAVHLKFSSLQLGTTIAAFGTTLPTCVATGVVARRGRVNAALGLVVASVLFNLLLTAGLVAMAQPVLIEERAIMKAIPVMALFTLLLLPVLLNDLSLPRWEGGLMLAAYAGFVIWQVLAGR